MDGTTIRVGTAELLESAGVMVDHAIAEAEKLQREGKTAVMVAANKGSVRVIGLLDTPKPEAAEAIVALKSLGIEPLMVTGTTREPQMRWPTGSALKGYMRRCCHRPRLMPFQS